MSRVLFSAVGLLLQTRSRYLRCLLEPMMSRVIHGLRGLGEIISVASGAWRSSLRKTDKLAPEILDFQLLPNAEVTQPCRQQDDGATVESRIDEVWREISPMKDYATGTGQLRFPVLSKIIQACYLVILLSAATSGNQRQPAATSGKFN